MFGLGFFAVISAILALVSAEAEGCRPAECHRGKQGRQGKPGPYGPPGFKGDVGLQGPLGPTGELATAMFADLYNANNTEVGSDDYLLFGSTNAVTADFEVATVDGETSLYFLKPGIFMVSFIVQYIVPDDPNPLPLIVELELNGYPVPYGRYSSTSSLQQLIGQTLIEVSLPGSVLKLKNVSEGIMYNNNQVGINASLNVVRYGPNGLNVVPYL